MEKRKSWVGTRDDKGSVVNCKYKNPGWAQQIIVYLTSAMMITVKN